MERARLACLDPPTRPARPTHLVRVSGHAGFVVLEGVPAGRQHGRLRLHGRGGGLDWVGGGQRRHALVPGGRGGGGPASREHRSLPPALPTHLRGQVCKVLARVDSGAVGQAGRAGVGDDWLAAQHGTQQLARVVRGLHRHVVRHTRRQRHLQEGWGQASAGRLGWSWAGGPAGHRCPPAPAALPPQPAPTHLATPHPTTQHPPGSAATPRNTRAWSRPARWPSPPPLWRCGRRNPPSPARRGSTAWCRWPSGSAPSRRPLRAEQGA